MKNFLKPTSEKIKVAILILVLAPFPVFYLPIPLGFSLLFIIYTSDFFESLFVGEFSRVANLLPFYGGAALFLVIAYLVACLMDPLLNRKSKLLKLLGYVLGIVLFSAVMIILYFQPLKFN